MSPLGAVVFVVRDVLQPGGCGGGIVTVLQHGNVLHEAAGRGGVPVLFAGRGVQGLAGVDLDDVAVAAAEPGHAPGDAEVLSAGVGVPGGAGSGGEPDGGDDHALVAFVRQGDGVQTQVADELLGRVLAGGLGWFDVHAFHATFTSGAAGVSASTRIGRASRTDGKGR